MAAPLIKPTYLRSGDTVAIVSPSWGGPGKFPHRCDVGIKELKKRFNVQVVEMPHTRADPVWLERNPKARADDLMQAFTDPSIKAVFASIGGDDSVRLLPYLDLKIIAQNPKIFMGYSDTTTLHFACLKAGFSSFYGPSIMAGFAENAGMHNYTVNAVQRTLYSSGVLGVIDPAPAWTVEQGDWEKQATPRAMRDNSGPVYMQGQGIVRGHLLGGCVEVLEMIKGSTVWPSFGEWRGAILFLETSEEAPSIDYVTRCLRHYGTLGILQVLNGVIMGRPGGHKLSDEERLAYDRALQRVVRDELGLIDLPIVTQMDFGHTDPMMVLPFGVQAEIDCARRQFSVLEAGVSP